MHDSLSLKSTQAIVCGCSDYVAEKLMTDMRMERNTVKQIKKTWDKKECV